MVGEPPAAQSGPYVVRLRCIAAHVQRSMIARAGRTLGFVEHRLDLSAFSDVGPLVAARVLPERQPAASAEPPIPADTDLAPAPTEEFSDR